MKPFCFLNAKCFGIILLALSLVTNPLTASSLISTEEVIHEVATERALIESLVQRKDVQQKIVEMGVSPEEASRRIASLSDTEVKQIGAKIHEYHAGGDGIYIGLGGLILLVILIYVLMR